MEGCVYQMTAPPRPRPGTRPRSASPRPAEIVLVGAHGGAGTSTLAALLGPAWDTGVIRDPSSTGALRTGGRPVVLVARNTVMAAGHAIAATTTITRQGTRIAVLVVVSDGLPEPAEARYRFRVLEGRVGAVVRMPFVPALRAAGNPRQVHLPRKARRALAQIRTLASPPSQQGEPLNASTASARPGGSDS